MPFVKKTDIAKVRELLLSIRDISEQQEIQRLSDRALSVLHGGQLQREVGPRGIEVHGAEPVRAAIRPRDATRIFYAADIHGSESCYVKFLNSAKFYNVDVLILAGDLTGKGIVPFVETKDGSFEIEFLGNRHRIRNKKKLAEIKQSVRDSGFYPLFTNHLELAEMVEDQKKREKVFVNLMVDTIRRWMNLADSKLGAAEIECYISPGNDDFFEIDSVLGESKKFVNTDGKVVRIRDRCDMLTLGYSNPSPWNLPRDTTEDDLAKRIGRLASAVTDFSSAIFNLHCPPYGSGLDMGPVIEPRPAKSLATRMPRSQSIGSTPIGSKAVRDAVKRFQPLVSLHGHVHESRGACRIGRTMCFNPGSEYSEGILLGLLLDIDRDGVVNYVFTSG
jgi:Icc-related predicted phosphoesterase